MNLAAPKTILEEIEKLIPKAAKTLNQDPILIREIYDKLIKPHITTLPEKNIPPDTIEKARKLVEEVDPSDWPFIALAIHLNAPLWTGDKEPIRLAVRRGFKEFIAVDTRGVEMLLEGKTWREIEEHLRREYR